MIERARQRMLAAVDEATGRNDCGEAVVLIQRPWWSYLVAMAVGVVLFLLVSAGDLGPIIGGAIAGGAAGGILALLGTTRVLGYCDGTVVLAASSSMRIKGTGVVGQWAYPLPGAEFRRGTLIHTVRIDGESYQLARTLDERFRSIVGLAAP